MLVMYNSVPYTRDELEYVADYVSDDLLNRFKGTSGIEYTDWKDFYGRWYYGHDHVHGCEFAGNQGSGSMD